MSAPAGMRRISQRVAVCFVFLLCAPLACAWTARAGEVAGLPLPPGLACGDFLAMAGKKPDVLEFLGCERGRDAQISVLAARYRVRGADAALAEDVLRRESGMAPLVFVCCRWEM